MRCSPSTAWSQWESCCAWSLCVRAAVYTATITNNTTWNPVTHKNTAVVTRTSTLDFHLLPALLAQNQLLVLPYMCWFLAWFVCITLDVCVACVCSFQFSSSCVEIHSACSHRLAGFAHVHIDTALICSCLWQLGRREGQVIYTYSVQPILFLKSGQVTYGQWNQVISFLTNWIRSFRYMHFRPIVLFYNRVIWFSTNHISQIRWS